MADLEKDLELKIAANANEATDALNGLITQLGRLNQSLSLGNLERFSTQLKNIADAAHSLSGISKDINAISSAGSKLASLTGFKTLNDQMQEVEAESQRLAKSVGDYFSFEAAKGGKKNVKDLADYLTSTMRAAARTGDMSVIHKEAETMGYIIRESSNTVKDVKAEEMAYASLAEWAKKTTIYLNEGTKANLKHSGSLNAIKAAFKGITSNPTKGTSLDNFMTEVEKFGFGGYGKNAESTITAVAGAVNRYNDAVKNVVVRGRDQISKGLVSEQDFQEAGRKLASNVEKSFGKIFSEKGTKKDLFGSLLPSLTELSGITIPDFSGLDVLAAGLERLTKINPKKIADTVNALNGIKSVSVAGGGSGIQQMAYDIEQVYNELLKSNTQANYLVDTTGKIAILHPDFPIREVARAFQEAGNAADFVVDKDGNIVRLAQEAADAVQGVAEGFELAIRPASALSTVIRDLSSGNKEIIDIDIVENATDSLNDAAEGFGAVGEGARGAAEAAEAAGEAAKEAGEDGEDAGNDANDATDELLKNLVVLGHEIQAVAKFFDGLGNAGIKALKVAFTPLTHLLGEYKEKIENVKSAFNDMGSSIRTSFQGLISSFGGIKGILVSTITGAFKPLEMVINKFKSNIQSVTSVFRLMRENVQKQLQKLSAFWKRAMKTFTFMVVRKAITAIIKETKDAVDSLATWSNQFGTAFNASISEISANASYLAKSIIGALEPVINAIIPLLNALTNAIARALQWIGEFFAALTGQNYFMIAKKNIGNYADSLNKANKAQKNLTMGIDELNILSENQNGGGSGGAAAGLGDWDTAPVSDKMKKLADDLKKLFEKLFDPLKKAWDRAKGYVISGFNYMTRQLKYLFDSIGRDFLAVWQQDRTVDMFTDILNIVGDLEHVVGNLARRFREAWDSGKTGKHILENIRNILAVLIRHVRNVTKYMTLWSISLDFEKLLDSIESLTRKLVKVADFVGGVFEDVMKNVILKYINFLISTGIPHLLDTIGKIIETFDFKKLRQQLVPVEKAFEKVLENIDTGITDAIGNVGIAVAKFTRSDEFQKFLDMVVWFMEQITAERVEKLFTILGNSILFVAKALMGFVSSDAFKAFLETILEWYDSIDPETIASTLERISKAIGEFMVQPETVAMFDTILQTVIFMKNAVVELAKKFGEAWENGDRGKHIIENLRDVLAVVLEHVRNIAWDIQMWAKFLNLDPLFKQAEELSGKFSEVGNFIGGVFEDVFKNVVLKYVQFLIEEGIPHLLETIGEIIDAFNFDELREKLVPVEEAFEKALENIDKGITDAIGNIGEAVAEFTQSEDFQKFLDSVEWFLSQITEERVSKLFTALGDAILKIAESLANFVSSDEFKQFIEKLLDWYDNTDPDQIADGLLNIAKAIGAFKFVAFVGEGVGGFIKFIATIQAAKNIGSILSAIGSGGAAAGAGSGAAAGGLGAMATAAAPIVAIIAGVATAVYSLVKSFGGVGEVFDYVKQRIQPLVDWVKMLGDAFNIGGTIEKLKTAFSDLGSALGNQKGLWQAIIDVVMFLANGIGSILAPAIMYIIGFVGDAIAGVVEFVAGVLDFIGGIFNAIYGFIEFLETGDGTRLSEAWDQILGGIGEAITGFCDFFASPLSPIFELVNSIVEFFQWLYDELVGHSIIPDLVDGIIGCFKWLKEQAEKIWDKIKEYIINPVKEAYNKGVEKFNALKDKAIEIWGNIRSKAEELWNLVKEKIITPVQEAYNNAVEKFNKLKEDAGKKWDETKKKAEETWLLIKEKIINPIVEAYNKVMEKVKLLKEEIGKKWDEIKKKAEDTWLLIKSHIIDPVVEAYNKTVEKFRQLRDDAGKAWDEFVKKIKESAIVQFFSNLVDKVKEVIDWFKKFNGDAKDSWNEFCSAIENSAIVTFISGLVDKVVELINKFKDLKGAADDAKGSTDEVKAPQAENHFNGGFVGTYATGGYPSRGTLFWAGEYGLPEMLGTVGGKTAVASSAEITGIRESVMESSIAEQNMMGQMINLLQTIALKDTSVNLDSRELVSSLNDRARRNGYNFRAATT